MEDESCATLTITCGLPGSGKTRWAREQTGAEVVERDALKRMMWGRWVGDPRAERIAAAVSYAVVTVLLALRSHVIVSDTNLDPLVVARLARIARFTGARLGIVDFTGVPVELCVERDAGRTGDARVGADAIRRMHARYIAGPLHYTDHLPAHRRRATERGITMQQQAVTDEQLVHAVTHHAPTTPEVEQAHATVRDAIATALTAINRVVPEGDRKRRALEHIEDAGMLANRQIAMLQTAA